METCLLFPIDGNLNLIAQYPLGLYHQALVEPDLEATEATEEEIEMNRHQDDIQHKVEEQLHAVE